jgi:hypothetical protein
MSAPTGREKIRYGTARSAEAMPAAAGDFVKASISSGKIIDDAVDPRVETTCPPHSSM